MSASPRSETWQVPRTRDLRTGEITHQGMVYIAGADGCIAFAANAPSVETIVTLARRAAAR